MRNPPHVVKKARLALAVTAAALGLAPSIAGAQDTGVPISDCLSVVGTYLTINNDGDDSVSDPSRSLISITNGGHAFFTDSGEGGGPGFAPFGDARGAWHCLSNEDGVAEFKAVVLDFTFITPAYPTQQIGRLDVQGTFDQETEGLSGTMEVYLVPMDGDPFDLDGVEASFSGDFTAERVIVE